MSNTGQIVLEGGRDAATERKHIQRCRHFATGVDRISAVIPGIFGRILDGRTTLTRGEIEAIGKLGDQVSDQQLKDWLARRLACTRKDWRRMNTQPGDAHDAALNKLVDAALRVRPALSETRNRADIAELLERFLERLEMDGRSAELERVGDG